MKIGVISDTHNHLDPAIRPIFDGVDHILHAGDIGLPWVILELEAIAPVTAVLGNNDTGLNFKETEIVELGGRKFLVHHIVDVARPSDTLRRRISRDKPDVVVFGHTHKRYNATFEGRLYFNPGYAGKPRLSEPRSVAIIHLNASRIDTEFHKL
jgi:putative phosphoesterase